MFYLVILSLLRFLTVLFTLSNDATLSLMEVEHTRQALFSLIQKLSELRKKSKGHKS